MAICVHLKSSGLRTLKGDKSFAGVFNFAVFADTLNLQNVIFRFAWSWPVKKMNILLVRV
jgi:hypothetical protein